CAASPGRVSAGQGAALFSVRGLLFLAASHLARRSPTPGPTGRGALGERIQAAPDARAPQRSGPPGRDDAARILLLAADPLARPQPTRPLRRVAVQSVSLTMPRAAQHAAMGRGASRRLGAARDAAARARRALEELAGASACAAARRALAGPVGAKS